jgi:hypothetical protein
MGTDVLEERVVSMFYLEDGGSMFYTHLPDYTVSTKNTTAQIVAALKTSNHINKGTMRSCPRV